MEKPIQDPFKSVPKKFTAVAAIDFGTSRSGYCFAFRKDPSRLYDSQNFGSESRNLKTKTALLMKRGKNGKLVFHSFGFQAEATYASGDLDDDESSSDEEEENPSTAGQNLPSKYEYFDRIKMNLHKDPSVPVMATSTTGYKVQIEIVIAECLRFLMKKILTEINRATSLNHTIAAKDIFWVLTIPAIWSNAAKQRMRVAAEMAGLAKQKEYDRLVLALEPEAAAIECRHFAKSVGSDLETGDKFLVVDVGGGTSDILGFQIKSVSEDDFEMKELIRPTGGPWGSTFIDTNFIKFLEHLVGSDVLNKFSTTQPSDWLSLRNAFVLRKENFVPSEDPNEKITMKMPELDSFLKSNGSSLKKAVEKFISIIDQNPEPEYAGGETISAVDVKCAKDTRLRISNRLMTSFYRPVMKSTIEHVESILSTTDSLSDLKYLFLVGGFSESKVFQNAVDEFFSKKGIRVVFPISPDLVIVRGAVRFGLSPDCIVSRKSRYSYGFATTRLFAPSKHPARLRFTTSTGEERCDNIFSVLVRSNDDVPVGFTVTKSLLPIDTAQEYMTLVFYASENRNVEYTDEPGVQQIGRLRLRMTDTDRDIRNRKVKNEISFGKTEIQLRVSNVHTGESVDGALDFLSR